MKKFSGGVAPLYFIFPIHKSWFCHVKKYTIVVFLSIQYWTLLIWKCALLWEGLSDTAKEQKRYSTYKRSTCGWDNFGSCYVDLNFSMTKVIKVLIETSKLWIFTQKLPLFSVEKLNFAAMFANVFWGNFKERLFYVYRFNFIQCKTLQRYVKCGWMDNVP